jgi:hypothetical protein
LPFRSASAIREGSFFFHGKFRELFALAVDCQVNRWMDIARQTNPHLEGCEEGGRKKRKFPSVTSLLLLAMTHFEVVKKMKVQASDHHFLAFFSDEKKKDYYGCWHTMF